MQQVQPDRPAVPETNACCEALGIAVPSVEAVMGHPEAKSYSLLIVALLESGRPMTLVEVARRFADAGIAPAERALLSLKRCKPARPPVYRDGDRYALDPHDDELDLWAFRLGLRPPKVRPTPTRRPEPAPLPGPDQPLTVAELDEAWRDAWLGSWSDQRLVLAVLDAHGGPMRPEAIVSFVGERTSQHLLRVASARGASAGASARHWRRGSPIRLTEDGRWEMEPGHKLLASARKSVRERLELVRRHAAMNPDPAAIEVMNREWAQARAARGLVFAGLRRVLVCDFPPGSPEAVVLVDVGRRTLETFFSDGLDEVRRRLASYDVVAAVNVRAVLRALGVALGALRLAELGPPQKSKKLNKRGRTLKITTAMLIQGSCRIARPLGDEAKMREYLRNGQLTQFRRRLESDAKALLAMYEYGRLHGSLRLRWGFLDERIPAPWVHNDEPNLYDLKRAAAERGAVIEVVTGRPPGWEHPWSRARRCVAAPSPYGYGLDLIDESGFVVDQREIQSARLVSR